jgi:hypothetical protein
MHMEYNGAGFVLWQLGTFIFSNLGSSTNLLLLNQSSSLNSIMLGVYSIDSSKTVANYPTVVNFTRLFLTLNRFICN